MRVFRFTFLVFLILFCFSSYSVRSQQVSNVRFEQEGKVIHISYDLAGEKGQAFNVLIYCSMDDEKSWGKSLQKVTGDVGENQVPGLNKKITWDVLSEREKLTGVISFKINATVQFSIGQSYGGGIIFYINGTGQHGLIAATSEQTTGAQWGCYGAAIRGTSTAIGTGQANTTAIVNRCSMAGIAARICNDLVLNGYSDWFLPSKDELNQMYLQKSVIGDFAGFYYWSSSGDSAISAWSQLFFNGGQFNSNKYDPYYVRAVRAF